MPRILVTGPSGVGKTHTMNILSDFYEEFNYVACDTDTFWTTQLFTLFYSLKDNEQNELFIKVITQGMENFEAENPDKNYIYFGLVDSAYKKRFNMFTKVFVLMPNIHEHIKQYLTRAASRVYLSPDNPTFTNVNGAWTTTPKIPTPLNRLNWVDKEQFIINRQDFETFAKSNNEFIVVNYEELLKQLLTVMKNSQK